ncbi:MAG: molecular chaperone TorD family protein [Trueperaceae bacterium]
MHSGALTSTAVRLEQPQLAAAYLLIAELLLYPEERDAATLEDCRRVLDGVPAVTEPIDAFLASPRADDLDEYLALLELAPTCPLYLGAYMFEEPSSCRGAGLSDRNAYMLELKAIYRHFGLDPAGNEMADFLPLVAEFLALALAQGELDGVGLRRRLLERHVAPALPALRQKLEKYQSPYARLIECLALLVEHDAASCPGPAWEDESSALELPMLKPFVEAAGSAGGTRGTTGGEEARP